MGKKTHDVKTTRSYGLPLFGYPGHKETSNGRDKGYGRNAKESQKAFEKASSKRKGK